MGFFKNMASVLVPLALASSPLLAKDSVNLTLFPPAQFSLATLPDSGIPRTQIELPFGLEEKITEKPLGELTQYASIGGYLPLISLEAKSDKLPEVVSPEVATSARERADLTGERLSDKLFSATLIANGSLTFPTNENPKYTAGVDLALEFPMRDSYLSDGNRLIIAPGFEANGSLVTKDLENKTLSELEQIFPVDSYGFLTNVYAIIKAPHSQQFLTLRAGAEDLFNSKGKYPLANISAAIELPSILKNLKALPYGAINIRLLLGYRSHELEGELGLKFPIKEGKSLTSYLRIKMSELNGAEFSSGIRIEL